MPVDQDGNRADMVMDAGATISRMNLGRLYEHYLGAAARDMSKRICTILGVKPKSSKHEVQGVNAQSQQLAYNELLSFYELIGPDMHGFFSNLNPEERIEHLWDVVREGIYLYIPIDNPKNIPDIVRDVQAKYPPIYGPVSYVGNSGERCITKNNVRIAPLYVMLLDKIADDWSSVSSGRLQHFGVLTPQTKSEKFSYPFRNSPVRTIGETEGRIFAGYCGRVAFAEMMDRSNSPYAQRNIVWNILKSKQPTNIDQIVDRKEIPLGNSKSLALVQHMLQTAGIRLVYKPESR